MCMTDEMGMRDEMGMGMTDKMGMPIDLELECQEKDALKTHTTTLELACLYLQPLGACTSRGMRWLQLVGSMKL